MSEGLVLLATAAAAIAMMWFEASVHALLGLGLIGTWYGYPLILTYVLLPAASAFFMFSWLTGD